MTVVALQSGVALLKLLFGLLSLRVSVRAEQVPAVPRACWRVVGVAFLLSGSIAVVQGIGAAAAFRAGPGSRLWELYLQASPVGNYSRIAVAVMLGPVLAAVPYLQRRGRVAPVASLVFGCAAAIGVGAGLLEGTLEEGRHFLNLTSLNAAEMISLFAALLIALASGSMDRLLWLGLALYGVRQALNVLWFSSLASNRLFGWWSPSHAQLHWNAIVMWIVLVALAGYRLALARRGTPVPAVLEPRAERPLSPLG